MSRCPSRRSSPATVHAQCDILRNTPLHAPSSDANLSLLFCARARILCPPHNHDHNHNQSGYLSAATVHKLINQHVLPLTHEDFRHIIKNVMQDERQWLNYNHIMQMYNPMKVDR